MPRITPALFSQLGKLFDNKAPDGSIGTAFQFYHPFNGQPDSIDLQD